MGAILRDKTGGFFILIASMGNPGKKPSLKFGKFLLGIAGCSCIITSGDLFTDIEVFSAITDDTIQSLKYQKRQLLATEI